MIIVLDTQQQIKLLVLRENTLFVLFFCLLGHKIRFKLLIVLGWVGRVLVRLLVSRTCHSADVWLIIFLFYLTRVYDLFDTPCRSSDNF